MNKLDAVQYELKQVVTNHFLYSLPEFLEKLRKSLCVSRARMSHDLDVPYLTLSLLEKGNAYAPVDNEIMTKLSEYFGIPLGLLQAKVTSYYPEKGLE